MKIFNYKKRWLNERILRQVPPSLKKNLIDNCSLTKRMFNNKSSCIKHISSKFFLSNKFNDSNRKYIYVRTVQLNNSFNEPILASSFILSADLKGYINNIKNLGNKSLATILYGRQPFSKKVVSYKISGNFVLRRTLYVKKKKRILVEESFPISNSYPELSLFNCRKNFMNRR